MAKLRLLFIKEGPASYISNLDLLRTFQRVFPRTGLDIKHSQGFHPHPIISFPLPLPVGQCSNCEIMDFEVDQETYPDNVAEILNGGMPEGIQVLDCYDALRPSKEIAYIKVSLSLEYDQSTPDIAKLNDLFDRQEILIEKRTKHKDLVETDIKPLIHQITFALKDGKVVGEAILSAQNPGLNPQYLLQAMQKHGPEIAPNFMNIRRLELLDEEFHVFR